jgi:hypothetical protein
MIFYRFINLPVAYGGLRYHELRVVISDNCVAARVSVSVYTGIAMVHNFGYSPKSKALSTRSFHEDQGRRTVLLLLSPKPLLTATVKVLYLCGPMSKPRRVQKTVVKEEQMAFELLGAANFLRRGMSSRTISG